MKRTRKLSIEIEHREVTLLIQETSGRGMAGVPQSASPSAEQIGREIGTAGGHPTGGAPAPFSFPPAELIHEVLGGGEETPASGEGRRRTPGASLRRLVRTISTRFRAAP